MIKQVVFAVFFAIVFVWSSFSSAHEIRVSHLASSISNDEGLETWQVLVMVRPDKPMKATVPLIQVSTPWKIDFVHPSQADLFPDRLTLFYVTVSSNTSTTSAARLNVSLPDHPKSQVSVEMSPGIDLSAGTWQKHYAGEKSRLSGISGIPGQEVAWEAATLPKMWDDIGITWGRTEIDVPVSWKGTPLFLTVSAVDDNDVTFFNGKEIGRTNGWDTLRCYPVPEELIRYGGKNELVIAIENVNSGGGIQSDPIWLGPKGDIGKTKLFPKPALQTEAERRPPRTRGKAFPLRPMRVVDGVLEYVDGGEVALWGVNYYPQSASEYRFLKEEKHDIKKVINADFDDLVRDGDPQGPNRINAIRIHVFDTEISDAEGNLLKNEHLDLLDYLVSRCNERNVHLWLTPIAWWGSGEERKAFSGQIPMQAMTLCPETWPIQQRFLKQFLEHVNPYTQRRLVEEPCLNLFEIINEPLYWTYGDMIGPETPDRGTNWVKPEDKNGPLDSNARYREKVKAAWKAALPGAEWESVETWDYYRYSTVRRYVDAMVETIRSTGAKQPIAYSGFSAVSPVFQAIADSRCDAVTAVLYPGGLQQKPQADARNLLPTTADSDWPAVLSEKARLVYEFDASDTLRQIDLYPAIARYFRNRGVQVACQFQYDSRFNAAHNRAWPTHYLNAIHAPERFVSFLIGGETFRTLPRGSSYKPENRDEWVFPPTAVSYSRNAALLCKEELFMQARTTDWRPLTFPVSPQRIITVGSTPYFDYDGTGIIDVHITNKTAEIRLNLDIVRLRHDTLSGTPEEPLTRLENRVNDFRMKLPGWETATLEVQSSDGWKPVADQAGTFRLESGKTYRMLRQ